MEQYILTFEEFLKKLHTEQDKNNIENQRIRNQELAGLRQSNLHNRYAIKITVEMAAPLLLEHEQYKQFKNSTDLYYKHPENPQIPVRAHYHIVDGRSKEEKYAVNIVDGSAHHRKNRGHQVPQKQADELRRLGVNLPLTNILESIESIDNQTEYIYTFYMILED